MGKNGNTPPHTPAALMAKKRAYPSDAVFGLNVRAMLEKDVRATEVLIVGRCRSLVRRGRWRAVKALFPCAISRMPLRECEIGSYKQYSAQSRAVCHILQWVIACDLVKREIRTFYVTRRGKQGDKVSSPNPRLEGRRARTKEAGVVHGVRAVQGRCHAAARVSAVVSVGRSRKE